MIVGGGGADALAGGAGADRFVYGALSDSTPSAYDTIYDFQSASDVIDLSGVSGPVVAILHTETGLSGVFYGYDGASSFGGAVLAVGRVEAFDIAAPAGTAFVETGSAVGDTLVGGAAGDVLTGGGGADYLYGGGGADLFRYAAVSDSTPSAADYIADFQHGSDKIDLSAVDGGAVNIVHGGQGDSYVFFAPIPGGAAGEITVTGDVEPGDLIVSAGAVVVVTGAFTPSVLGGAPPTHLAWEHWAWIGSHAVLA